MWSDKLQCTTSTHWNPHCKHCGHNVYCLALSFDMLFAVTMCHDRRGKIVPLVLKSVKSLRSSLCKVLASSDAAHVQSDFTECMSGSRLPCVLSS